MMRTKAQVKPASTMRTKAQVKPASMTGTTAQVKPASMNLTKARVGLAVGLAIPFLCAWRLSEFANTVVVQMAIGILTAAGLHVLVHWTGQISLAQVALMGVGAFVTARANADFSVPLPLAVLVGVAGAVVASLAIGLPALRIRGLALAITTLAFAFAASRWLFVQPWLVPQVSGIPLRDGRLFGFDITESSQLVIPVGLACVGVVALTNHLGKSALGRSLRMVAHDEEVAAASGISVPAHKLLAFCYAAACAGLAGAFTVISIGRVGPQAFPVNKAVLYLSAVLLGGPGPVFASLRAAAGFAAFPVLFRGLGRFIDLLGPLAILAVVIASPAGLNGLDQRLHHALSRRRTNGPTAPVSGGGTS